MIFRFRFSLLLVALLNAFPVLAEQHGVVILDSSSKEVKRTAHRLRIPVEQLKNARQALQEATDLAGTIDPYPTQQLTGLAQLWSRLNPEKAKTVVNSFIQDLRSEATKAGNEASYFNATSAAMALLQSTADLDPDQMLEIVRNWPQPDQSLGMSAKTFRDNQESQFKNQILFRLASTDPQKALSILQDQDSSGSPNYGISAQVAQGLSNSGNREEALKLIDRTMNDFGQHATDPRALQEYENFVSMIASLDSARASKAMGQLLTAETTQPASGDCSGQLKSGDVSVDLTCSESKVLNLLRRFPMRPGFTMNALDSVPGLKSKLESIGGVDSLYNLPYGGSGVSITTKTPSGQISYSNSPAIRGDPGKLIQELKGKAEKDPALVKAKLRDAVKGPENIDMLINLATMASYQDPDLGDLALEVAQDLFPSVEPLQRRAATLQNLVRAYRQVDGEVDTALMRDGFVLAEKIRQESRDKSDAAGSVNAPNQPVVTAADQLEASLVSEFSRDSFDKAMSYVRSMENNASKLVCLIQIAQALMQPNY